MQHGIHDCMETGKIRMSIHKDGDDLEITVSDNGAGMTQEMIRSVMAGKARNNGEDRYSTGIAVGNVIDRLELYYKQKRSSYHKKVRVLDLEPVCISPYLWSLKAPVNE